ncbi:MAG: hypothetical protein LBR67_01925 [Dysgonamonadaceae bacterium]|jgi:hypothetical protein|nr:hypothetical protein [Dysgonamonadaceae bacterium]
MKNTAIIISVLFLSVVNLYARQGRSQWTEKKAWAWHQKVGAIKGFNEPYPAYPGMSNKDILKKAAELGFNCVRFWLKGNTPDEQETFLRQMIAEADEFGLKSSPVLSIEYIYYRKDDLGGAKKYVQQLIGAFADDERIALWDIWNEPNWADAPERSAKIMDWLKSAVEWSREMSPIQPISASIFIDCGNSVDSTNKYLEQWRAVEAMMDIHNFHFYDCGQRQKDLEPMINYLRQISDRPLACTEVIARTKGSSFPRSLSAFSKYHIHFFSWGLYMNDRNWTVTWGNSTYEPFDPPFHDLLHPDGEPYDRRDLDWIRNFHFAQEGETTDPGAEMTERWPKDRAWRWMALGPVKGYSCMKGENDNLKPEEFTSKGYNALRIRCDYREWTADKQHFFQQMDELLASAEKAGLRVMPVLLTDGYSNEKDTALAAYVADVIKRYATNPVVQAWEIYEHPGETQINTARLTALLHLLFRVARLELPNQPLTATPFLSVKDFPDDYKYREALIHGITGGWNQLVCEGGSTPELCNLVWQLSDITAFSSDQAAPETGWLASMAYRYGRPVVCTSWQSSDNASAQQTLDIFAKSHVFWYLSGDSLNEGLIKQFRFIPISTPIR